ncbi:MAG: tripartite tricarboxylate transporter substrate binding protein [Betaproteobacteria bacterium]|nr:tripartite tricarboxylate transporter substrate binding protein [Betaproteobacteria bacterium]
MSAQTSSCQQGAATGRTTLVLLAAALALQIAPATGQDYPTKPLRMIVPFAPGGPADMLGRLIGEKLLQSLGQPVVVHNKGGAGTILGVDLAAKSNPDGYTLLLGNVAMIINASTGKKLPYHTLKDLTPVSLVFTQPLILVLSPSVPIGSVKELVAYAKANPGKLRYGSSGVGTSIHLTTELFRTAVAVELTHVPYKGVAPAMIDLLGARIDMMFPGIAPALPHVRSGKLKALALTSKQRSSVLPDVPTLDESGVANFESIGWYGILVPSGVPAKIAARLNKELVSVMALPDVRERLASQGGDAVSSTRERFAAFMRSELKKWTGIIRSTNIRVE